MTSLSEPHRFMQDALDTIRQSAQITNHDDLRQAVLDDCVEMIAEQLHRASAAYLAQVPDWASVSATAKAVYRQEATVAVAARSALSRGNARVATLELAERRLADVGEDDLIRETVSCVLEEHPRELARAFAEGRR